MIPKDIETTEQWQVRWQSPTGEVTRTGTEGQVRYMASTRQAFSPVIEVRTITVGQWRNPDAAPKAFEEETDGED